MVIPLILIANISVFIVSCQFQAYYCHNSSSTVLSLFHFVILKAVYGRDSVLLLVNVTHVTKMKHARLSALTMWTWH